MISGAEWRECADWLARCGLVSAEQRVLSGSAELLDLVELLRDGVLLCRLAEWLSGLPLDRHQFSDRAVQGSSVLCARNIGLFLQLCAAPPILLPQADLFAPHDLLYGENFLRVLHTLAVLSHCPQAALRGVAGFATFGTRDEPHQLVPGGEHEYYNMLPQLTLGLIKRRPTQRSPNDARNEKIYHEVVQLNAETLLSRKRQMLQKASPAERAREKLSMSIWELLDTEQTYVDSLQNILNDYGTPLKPLMTPDVYNTLFAPIENLVRIHSALCEEMRSAVAPDVPLLDVAVACHAADTFVRQARQLTIYGEFCAQLPRMRPLLEELCGRNAQFRRKLADCEKASSNRFSLVDRLALPFQRICRYSLLLKATIGHLDPQDVAACESLNKAVSTMDDLNSFVNEAKRDSEKLALIGEIEQRISGLVVPANVELKDFGHMLRDGELRVMTVGQQRTPKLRTVFLFHKIMLVCKPHRRDKFNLKETLRVREYRFVRLPLSTGGSDGVVLSAQLRQQMNDAVAADRGGFAFGLAHSSSIQSADGTGRWSARADMHGFLCSESFVCIAKNDQLCQQWQEAFEQALDDLTPASLAAGGHTFEISSFIWPTTCHKCSLLLKGLFFQGYQCQACRTVAHKACLPDVPRCHQRPRSAAIVQPSMSFSSLLNVPRRRTVASIGDEAPHLPPRLLTPPPLPPPRAPSPTGSIDSRRTDQPTDAELSSQPWFAGQLTEADARQVLSALPTGTFLVRHSGGRAEHHGQCTISFKYATSVYHIRINRLVNNFGGSPDGRQPPTAYFIVRTQMFPSIAELVAFYQRENLQPYFNNVTINTTLRLPYRLALDWSAASNAQRRAAPADWCPPAAVCNG